MTLRNYILFGVATFAAVLAGILLGTHGREKLLAAAVALAVVGAVWIFTRRGWVRQNPDSGPPVNYKPMRPRTLLIIAVLCLCSTVWDINSFYRRGNWLFVAKNVVLTLWFLYVMYLAMQRWNKNKNIGA